MILSPFHAHQTIIDLLVAYPEQRVSTHSILLLRRSGYDNLNDLCPLHIISSQHCIASRRRRVSETATFPAFHNWSGSVPPAMEWIHLLVRSQTRALTEAGLQQCGAVAYGESFFR